MKRAGAECFPSLVEAARAIREPEWRRLDEEAEPTGTRPMELADAIRARAFVLEGQGLGVKLIAKELGTSPNTVRRALGRGPAGRAA